MPLHPMAGYCYYSAAFSCQKCLDRDNGPHVMDSTVHGEY